MVDDYHRLMVAERPAARVEPTAGTGLGGVRIVSVEILGNAAASGRIEAGQPFRVRLGVEAAARGPGV